MRLMKEIRIRLRKWREKYLNFSNRTYKIIWGVLFFIIIALTLSIDLIPDQVDLRPGQVSQSNITAPRTITFIDESRTEELRQRAEESAPRVYEEDGTVERDIRDRIDLLFDSIIEERESVLIEKLAALESPDQQVEEEFEALTDGSEPELSFSEEELGSLDSEDINLIMTNIKDEITFEISDENLETLITLPEEELEDIRTRADNLLISALSRRILPAELSSARDNISQSAMEMDISRDKRLALAEITENTLEANMFLNTEATEARRQEAVGQIEPIQNTVRQGEIIVRQGDVVTEADIEILERLGLQRSELNYFNIFGRILIAFIIVLLLAFYFHKYKKNIWEDNSQLLLIEILIVIVLLLAKTFSFFQNPFVDFLVPTAMASILLTILIDTDTALVTTLFLSMLIAPIYDMNYNIVLTSLLGGLVAIYSVSKVKERGDIIRAGLNISVVLMFLIGGLSLLQESPNWNYMIWAVGGGITNGLLVGVLANGFLPYLEDLFDMTSSVKLLELSNPSQVVLKRMLVEAPGTYHHSIIVGNLAETAAEDVGADSLLARAAAYYHDIGKLKRPYFFSENHFGAENPHDKTSPNLSALIIKSHVKDGVEMAEEYGIPGKIIDIIKEHHGTNLISYFYQQAIQENKHDDIEKKIFVMMDLNLKVKKQP